MLGILLHHLLLLPLAGVLRNVATTISNSSSIATTTTIATDHRCILQPHITTTTARAAAAAPPPPPTLATAGGGGRRCGSGACRVPSRKPGKALKLCVYTDNKYNAQRTVYSHLLDTSKQTRTSGSPRNSLNTVFTFEWCPSIHGKTRHHKCFHGKMISYGYQLALIYCAPRIHDRRSS